MVERRPLIKLAELPAPKALEHVTIWMDLCEGGVKLMLRATYALKQQLDGLGSLEGKKSLQGYVLEREVLQMDPTTMELLKNVVAIVKGSFYITELGHLPEELTERLTEVSLFRQMFSVKSTVDPSAHCVPSRYLIF